MEKKFKELRVESGLKADKIAKEVGISRTQLYRIETNKIKVPDRQLDIFSQLYKTSIQELKGILEDKNDKC